MTQAIAIVAAKRTAIGSFMGSLTTVPAPFLGAHVITALLQETGVAADQVDEVIMGQVLTAGQGQNPARQAAIHAGLGAGIPALTINQVCGSGLRAVAMAAQAIAVGDAQIIIAGGQENMSMAQHAVYARQGVKFGDQALKDTMIVDGLWDAFGDMHMGVTAENIANRFGISRAAQDAFAAHSQQKCEQAQASNIFTDEIAPIAIKAKREETVFAKDEYPRTAVDAQSLAQLRPAFAKDGSVTAGNASGLNDGAAALMLMPLSLAQEKGLPVMGVIRAHAVAGVDPDIMGTGPVPATKMALQKAGWQVDALDLIEANEAFAAQACYVIDKAGFDPDKVNVYGGAIALGHPIGASGARVLVTLLHAMQRRDVSKGLATLCIGGGMGIAMCVERETTS